MDEIGAAGKVMMFSVFAVLCCGLRYSKNYDKCDWDNQCYREEEWQLRSYVVEK